jgi:hypothetical protein
VYPQKPRFTHSGVKRGNCGVILINKSWGYYLLHFKNMTNIKKTNNIYTISFTLASKLQYCLQNKINRKGLHTLPVVPAIKYPNAELQKKQIMQDNKGKAGVYR